MAKIKVAGDRVIVESTKTLEEIKTLEKYRPKALCLYDEEGNETFKVGTSTKGDGSIGTYGATFCKSSMLEDKKAIVTIPIPEGTEDAVAFVEEKVGMAIVHLNEVEAGLDDALEAVSADKQKVRNSITVVA